MSKYWGYPDRQWAGHPPACLSLLHSFYQFLFTAMYPGLVDRYCKGAVCQWQRAGIQYLLTTPSVRPSSSSGTDKAQKLSGCCICLMSNARPWDRLEFMHCDSWTRW